MRTLLILALVACTPKPAPVAPPVEVAPAEPVYVPAPPTPLAPRPFSLPEVKRATLKNGATVVLVENHETPFVSVSINFRAGTLTDPKGKAGLAEATMDMLNEGVKGKDALAISAELRRLGAGLSTGAGYDGASVAINSMTPQLPATLDVLADVLLRPTFPAADWDRRKALWLDDIEAGKQNPSSIAEVVMRQVLWGNQYRGLEANEASLAKITPKDMAAWHRTWLAPSQAMIFVGGDTTLEQIVPLLEARLSGWSTKPATLPARPATPKLPEKTVVYLVDRPGSAQSLVRAGAYLLQPTDPDWSAFVVANMAVGGQFTSRINMNLREQKGYTYGARSGVSYDLGGGQWSFSAGIHTEKTALALAEVFRELKEARTDRPITTKEADDARGALLNGWPLHFETPDHYLGQLDAMWTFGLPDTWVTGYRERASRASAEEAQKSWAARIDPDKLSFVVVGDAARVRPEIEALGLVVVPVDVDGNPVGVK